MNGRTVEVSKWIGHMQYGSKRDAIAAVDGTLPMLGRGACRKVYKGKSPRIVYKVTTSGDNRANVSEYERMLRVQAFDHNIATPCTLYMVDGVAVLAMVERPHDSDTLDHAAYDRFMQRLTRYNRESGDHIGDMHGQNYRATPSGKGTVTDCGDVIIGW